LYGIEQSAADRMVGVKQREMTCIPTGGAQLIPGGI
jgi:hypothetical protein